MSLNEGVWDHRRIILRLDIERVRTIDSVRDFVAGSAPVDFHFTDRGEAYDFVTRTLRRLNYTGYVSRRRTGAVALPRRRPRLPRSTLANGVSPTRKVVPGSCASTRFHRRPDVLLGDRVEVSRGADSLPTLPDRSLDRFEEAGTR